MNAKEIFFEKLRDYFDGKDYTLIKSKSIFRKKINNFDFLITIKFGGGGGLSVLDGVSLTIIKNGYETKKITFQNKNLENGELLFPTMYSRNALSFANQMNLKKLSQMKFDEKYPLERIDNAVQTFIEFIENTAVVFFIENSNI